MNLNLRRKNLLKSGIVFEDWIWAEVEEKEG